MKKYKITAYHDLMNRRTELMKWTGDDPENGKDVARHRAKAHGLDGYLSDYKAEEIKEKVK